MLVNRQIRTLGPGLWEPYDATSIHPQSIGLHVGDGLLVESHLFNGHGHRILQKFQLPGMVHSIAWSVLDLFKAEHSSYRPWSLSPRNFILATTQEVLNLPEWITGTVVLSEAARMNGYGLTPQLVPAGHNGPLTLALTNLNSRTILPIFPGLQIAELVLEELNTFPDPELTALPVHEDAAPDAPIAEGEYLALES